MVALLNAQCPWAKERGGGVIHFLSALHVTNFWDYS